MTDTDEDFHVMFAYEGDHPDHGDVYEELPFGHSAGAPLVEHGDVVGSLVTVPDGWPSGISDLSGFVLDVQQTYLAAYPDYNPPQGERLESLFDVVKAVYQASDPPPTFVYGLQHNMEEALYNFDTPPPADSASLREDRIDYAVWLNVFSPRLVETYGRERLLSAPVWRAEELADGAIMLVYDDDPFFLASFGDLNEHLGLSDPGL